MKIAEFIYHSFLIQIDFLCNFHYKEKVEYLCYSIDIQVFSECASCLLAK